MIVQTKIKKQDIKPGNTRVYSVGDVKIVVCNVDGKYFAVEDICSHDDGVLVSQEGTLVDGCQIECPRHGARFDVTTGQAKKMPAASPIKTYVVIDSGEDICIEVAE